MTFLLYYKITHFSIYPIKKQWLNKNFFGFSLTAVIGILWRRMCVGTIDSDPRRAYDQKG